MLAVRDGDGSGSGLAVAGLDAGTVAAAVARSWAGSGRDVLLVDADAHGTRLAARISAAARLALQPARRGLPSLIASRSAFDAETVSRHCWLLPTQGAGSVHLLGAPAHPDGARRTARWLAERCGELAALEARWAVIVSMPGPTAQSYESLIRAASQRLVLTVTPGTVPVGGLRAVGTAFWLRFTPDPEMRLRAAGIEPIGPHGSMSGAAAAGSSAPLVGGTRRARPAALLGARPRRRDRVLLEALAEVAGRLGDPAGSAAGPPRLRGGTNGLASQQCAAAAQAAGPMLVSPPIGTRP